VVASGYNKRRRVETAIGRYKQGIGAGLCFRKDGRRATEVFVAVHALNQMQELGRPISVRIKLTQIGLRSLRPFRRSMQQRRSAVDVLAPASIIFSTIG
jgi:hypothetical protein